MVFERKEEEKKKKGLVLYISKDFALDFSFQS